MLDGELNRRNDKDSTKDTKPFVAKYDIDGTARSTRTSIFLFLVRSSTLFFYYVFSTSSPFKFFALFVMNVVGWRLCMLNRNKITPSRQIFFFFVDRSTTSTIATEPNSSDDKYKDICIFVVNKSHVVICFCCYCGCFFFHQ